MDYEKLHKDTIAKLQEMVNSGKITVETACGICADFIPESEDEMMIKFIKNQLFNIKKTITENYEFDAKLTKAIDWLENQGKHANFISKIQVGDKVTRNEDGVLVNLSQLNRVVKKDEKQGNNMGISEATRQKLEDNLNKALEKETPESWNKFLDEQKPAWGEEDKKMSIFIGNAITTNGASIYLKSKGIQVIDAHVWLNELKERVQPQNRWKPSREQIETLEYYMHTLVCNNYKETLFGLYQDLKKLKGK